METGSRISLEVDFLHVYAGAFRRKLLSPVIDRNLNIKLFIRSRGMGLKLIEGIEHLFSLQETNEIFVLRMFFISTFLPRRNFEFYFIFHHRTADLIKHTTLYNVI